MAELLLSLDPKTILPIQYQSKLKEFIELYEFEQVCKLILSNSKNQNSINYSAISNPINYNKDHYSFYIHYQDLIHYDSVFAYLLIYHPKLLLPILEVALVEYQCMLINHNDFKLKYKRKHYEAKSNCHIRLINIPYYSEVSKSTISDLRSFETTSLIQLAGTIVRTSGIKMLEVLKQYHSLSENIYNFTNKNNNNNN